MSSTSLPLRSAESPLALLSLFASGLVWGFAWLPLKYFAGLGIDGHSIALTAYALVALVSFPLVWRERAAWRGETHYLLLIGLCFGVANFALTWALMAGSVVRAMLLFFLMPAWGAIGGKLFLKETLGWRRLMTVALCLSGVFTIVGGVEVFTAPLSFGDAAAFIAGIFYTLAGIANRAARAIPIASRTLMSFIGCTTIAVIGLALHPVTIPALPAFDWTLLALFAFIWLMGGTALTTYGVTHVDVSRAAVLQVTELVVAVLSAVLIGGEHFSAGELVGGAMILAASLLEAISVPPSAVAGQVGAAPDARASGQP